MDHSTSNSDQLTLTNAQSSAQKNPMVGKGPGTAFMPWTPFNQMRQQQNQTSSQQFPVSSGSIEGTSAGNIAQGFVRNMNSSELIHPPPQQGLIKQLQNSIKTTQEIRKLSFESEISDSHSDSSVRKKLQGLQIFGSTHQQTSSAQNIVKFQTAAAAQEIQLKEGNNLTRTGCEIKQNLSQTHKLGFTKIAHPLSLSEEQPESNLLLGSSQDEVEANIVVPGGSSSSNFINQRLNQTNPIMTSNHHIIKPTAQHHHYGSPALHSQNPFEKNMPINLTQVKLPPSQALITGQEQQHQPMKVYPSMQSILQFKIAHLRMMQQKNQSINNNPTGNSNDDLPSQKQQLLSHLLQTPARDRVVSCTDDQLMQSTEVDTQQRLAAAGLPFTQISARKFSGAAVFTQLNGCHSLVKNLSGDIEHLSNTQQISLSAEGGRDSSFSGDLRQLEAPDVNGFSAEELAELDEVGGSLSRDQKNEKILKYWEKKKRRKSQRFIRYECRKNLAEKRFRYQGRFVKFEQLQELDPSLIYNPNQQRIEPKTKPIFKVIKTAGSGSEGSRRSSISLGRSSGRDTGRGLNHVGLPFEQNFLSDITKQADTMNLFTGGTDQLIQPDDVMASANYQMSQPANFGAFGTKSFGIQIGSGIPHQILGSGNPITSGSFGSANQNPRQQQQMQVQSHQTQQFTSHKPSANINQEDQSDNYYESRFEPPLF